MSVKGALRKSDISLETLHQLNKGESETKTLVEALSVDFIELAKNATPQLHPIFRNIMSVQFGITKKMRLSGKILADNLALDEIKRLMCHPSDTVRGWTVYAFSELKDLPLHTCFDTIRPLADDPHFGVREWAWLSFRSQLEENLIENIDYLKIWALDISANIRRYASEITRPRGVWCKHIQILKENPELGLPILDPLKSDPSRYVQDSVANWLNDAAKSQSQWVTKLCHNWQEKYPNLQTGYICKRALRSLK